MPLPNLRRLCGHLIELKRAMRSPFDKAFPAALLNLTQTTRAIAQWMKRSGATMFWRNRVSSRLLAHLAPRMRDLDDGCARRGRMDKCHSAAAPF